MEFIARGDFPRRCCKGTLQSMVVPKLSVPKPTRGTRCRIEKPGGSICKATTQLKSSRLLALGSAKSHSRMRLPFLQALRANWRNQARFFTPPDGFYHRLRAMSPCEEHRDPCDW